MEKQHSPRQVFRRVTDFVIRSLFIPANDFKIQIRFLGQSPFDQQRKTFQVVEIVVAFITPAGSRKSETIDQTLVEKLLKVSVGNVFVTFNQANEH